MRLHSRISATIASESARANGNSAPWDHRARSRDASTRSASDTGRVESWSRTSLTGASGRLRCDDPECLNVVALLQLKRVQARHRLGRLAHARGRLPVEDAASNDVAQLGEMVIVVRSVIGEKARLMVRELQLLAQQLGPAPGFLHAEPLDDEHGAEQIERIRLARVVEHERGERLAADVLGLRGDLEQGAAHGDEIALEHLVVLLLVAGVRN